jgi:hypothetical protein
MKRRIYPTFLLMIFLMSNAYSGGPATSGNYLAGTGFPGKMVRTGLYFSLGIRFLVSDRKYSAPSLELFQISGFAVRV